VRLARLGKEFAVAITMFVFGCAPIYAQGQAVNAQLNGTVTDPNDAGVPGAKVTLSNAEVGFSRQFTTSDTGQYTFSLIPPGTYELRVAKPGFDRKGSAGTFSMASR